MATEIACGQESLQCFVFMIFQKERRKLVSEQENVTDLKEEIKGVLKLVIFSEKYSLTTVQ